MSEFIRKIGSCSVNGISFSVYENKDGSATVRPCKLSHEFPNSKWIEFESLEVLEEKTNKLVGEDYLGARRVHALKRIWL